MAEGEEKDNDGVKVVGYWVSLFTHRVRWALTLKGVHYQYLEDDIFNKSPTLLSLNPVHGRVPVLVHGNPLPESQIILEYIEDTWTHAPPLLPQDPYQRSQLRFWARFVDEKVLESAWHLMFARREKKEQAVKTAMEDLGKVEDKLSQMGGQSFFGGDTIGHLDLVMGFVACTFPAWEEVAGVKVLEPVKFPALTAWATNFLNHPVVKGEYMPPREETVAYYRRRVEELLPAYIARFGE